MTWSLHQQSSCANHFWIYEIVRHCVKRAHKEMVLQKHFRMQEIVKTHHQSVNFLWRLSYSLMHFLANVCFHVLQLHIKITQYNDLLDYTEHCEVKKKKRMWRQLLLSLGARTDKRSFSSIWQQKQKKITMVRQYNRIMKCAADSFICTSFECLLLTMCWKNYYAFQSAV